jgi:CMP-N,N'-diacetyllegionaminic acid synthase
MFILGLICCRGGSKGVKDKNIRPFCGRPLLVYTIDEAFKCNLLNDVIVSADSSMIKKTAKEAGIRHIIHRPEALATDTVSKWPVFLHALETYQQEKKITVDYIVDMDVTVPLKTSEDISRAIQFALDNPDADVVITGYEPERNPYFNMMETGEDGYAHIVKQTEQPIVRRQDAPPVYSLTPAVYVIKSPALYAYEHWSKARCKIYAMPRERSVDIDTELDFKMVEFLKLHQ